MEIIYIKKSEMAGALKKAGASYVLAGPVKTDNGHTFRRLEKGRVPDLEYTQTSLSAKDLVFPQSECMLYFENDRRIPLGRSVKEPQAEDAPVAAVGIRPYDAKAIQMLRLNFDTEDVKDPYFIRRIENLTLVGLAENEPDAANFSLSCGTGPFDEFCLDILLVDTGEGYAGKILTQKGKKFADAAGFPKAGAEVWQKTDAVKQQAQTRGSEKVSFEAVQSMEILEMYESPVWEELAFACINCSTCTFVCPTCWCFDIQDESGSEKGVRIKLWDSCMSDLYSAHASGHNPRQEGWKRFRNRFMHKLKYFSDKYGQGAMCVGCGRCIRSCPAGIDIRIINDALSRSANESQTAQVKEVAK